MPENNGNILNHLWDLKKNREQLMALPPSEVMKKLMEDEQALAIVHSFPAQDFHMLIQEIGPEEALPILSLASNNQWEHCLDIEIWQKDRLDITSATRWLKLLLTADPDRLATWCINEKTTFIELFLIGNIEIRVREHDQNPSEFGNDFTTFDDIFYFRIINPVLEDGGDPDKSDENERILKERQVFLTHLLRRLSDADHHKFQGILLEAMALIPAESVEEDYRIRNVRLAEKGFLTFEDSIGIYQPLSLKNLKTRKKVLDTGSVSRDTFIPVPYYAQDMLEPDNLFSKVLQQVQNDSVLMQLQSEFANLCNQMLVADQLVDKGRGGLRAAVDKAASYIGIGLESMGGDKTKLIEHHLLKDIFRLGYGQAMQLKWQAEKWREQSWLLTQELPLSFWGEEWFGIIGGLLLKRPLYFDNYQTGSHYREFRSLDDIKDTREDLNEIVAFDELLARLSLPVRPTPDNRLLTFKNLLLTHWAKHYSHEHHDNTRLQPIPLGPFKSFFEDLWRSTSRPRAIKQTVKSDFLIWLAETSGRPGPEITANCGKSLEALFLEIEEELGQISADDLDPRIITLFLIE